MKELDELLGIMKTLRDPEAGCPWDREQTHATILPYTIEEVYELAEAIQAKNVSSMRDELGDLLFQIIFYCQMAGEKGDFVFTDVVKNINKKLVRRHPHVFADESIDTASQQTLSWERIKQKEREESGEHGKLLDSVSPAMPALIHALKLQKKAATVGFDWQEPGPVLDKIEEELGEVRQAMQDGNKSALSGELGDLLFACVNLARHTNIDPETALMQTNRKFRQRFNYIEESLAAKGTTLDNASLEEMDGLWEESKKVKG